MTALRLALLLLLAAPLAAPARAQAPINDDDRTAKPIYGGQTSYEGTTVGATASAVDAGTSASTSCISNGTDNDADNAVWWAFTATASGTVTIDLDQSGFDTILMVIHGNTVTGCNDDGPGNGLGDFTSELSVAVTPGLYLVRVSGYNSDPEGTIQMSVSGSGIITGPPNNNDPLNSPVLGLLPNGIHPDTNRGGTRAANEPPQSCVFPPTANDFPVWRAFRAPSDGMFTFHTFGSSTDAGVFDSVVSIYTVVGGAFHEVGCNDDGPTDVTSELTIPVTSGTVYYVQTTSYEYVEGDLVYTTSFAPSNTASEDEVDAGLAAFLPPSPNPSAGSVRLGAELSEAGPVRVEVLDALGRAVDVLHDGPVAAGTAWWTWDGGRQPAGVYMVRLTAGDAVRMRRVTLVR